MTSSIKETLTNGTPEEIRSLLAFDDEPIDHILFKFNLWSRRFFSKYFTSKDAPFHKEIDKHNLEIYLGRKKYYVDIAFRGAAKTARTKLLIAFCIANDMKRRRKYMKILAEDGTNSKQATTDIYNMLIDRNVASIYPEIFEKSNKKREETMSSFTTSTGIKVLAGTVGQDQRGAIQEESRPDLIWFDDFENRKTLRSAVKTKAIWDNMEEARTSLSKDGGCIYTCNYISELGNVHKLVTNKSDNKVVQITPITKDGTHTGEPSWDRYTKEDIAQMIQDDDDFEGERLCKPSASKDILFPRDVLNEMEAKEPIRNLAGFKIYYKYDASHRYAAGHDIGGGVGLDSSTSVFIDFDTVPARVVATFADNEIKPDVFGAEIKRQTDEFGGCLSAPEQNNHGHATIAIAKQQGVNLWRRDNKDTAVNEKKRAEYGWNTNAVTKPKMLSALVKAVADGHLQLTDEDLIAEAKSYSRNDLIDREPDPRLTTRHFDLLMACAIAWQMKDETVAAAQIQQKKTKRRSKMTKYG